MNLFTRKNNKLQYNSLAGDVMFADIIDCIDDVDDLEIILPRLCNSLQNAVNDWYEDHDIEDSEDRFQIDVWLG